MFQKNLKKSAFVAVLVALAASGSAFAEDAPATPKADAKDAKPAAKVKPGEAVDVEDGGTVTVDLSEDAPTTPKADAKDAKPAAKVKPMAVKGNSMADAKDGSSGEPAKPVKVASVMADDFSSTKADDEIDTDSMVELAARGVLHPSGPAIGATLGFTWRPANRVRIHAGFDASKGLLELKGQEKELIQFGFTAAVTRVMTRTVEFGGFGAMSWSYRDLVKDVSASFIGVGPGFRLNKAGGLIFFEAAIPIGLGKKFASGDWSMNHALQASLGFHF